MTWRVGSMVAIVPRGSIPATNPNFSTRRPASTKGHIHASDFFAQYNAEKLSLTAEYAVRRFEEMTDDGLFSLDFFGESYYLQALYRFDQNWQAILRYDAYYKNRDDKAGWNYQPLTGKPNYTQFAKDWTFGLRYYFNPSFLIAAEYHYVDGTAWLPIQDNPDPDRLEQRWHMFSLHWLSVLAQMAQGIIANASALRSGFFLSLKWKALLLSSMALILVTGTLVTINYIELRNQFEQRRAELQGQYAHQTQGLLDQSDRRLRQWSTIMASLLSVGVSAGRQDEERIITEFERLAAILELDMGAESILLVSSNGWRLAVRGLDANFDERINLVEASRQVVTMEKPASLIDCFDTCLQYSIAPILGTGDALVVGVSLADVVLDFQRVSGTDLGLLVGGAGPNLPSDPGNAGYGQWNVQVVALTNAWINLDILRTAAEIKTLPRGFWNPSMSAPTGVSTSFGSFPWPVSRRGKGLFGHRCGYQ